MALRRLLLRTLLLSVFTAVVHCEEEFFNITRTRAFHGNDQFVVPPSICKRTSTQLECRKFHVRASIVARRCECRCPYEASTFGYVSGSWSCLKNTEFRRQAGCTYKFQSEYDDGDPMEVLDTGRQQPPFIESLPSNSCKIDLSSSRYFKCDGSWSGLGLSKNSDVFQLSGDAHGPPWDYTLKIKKKASLAGRIVKLQLNCGPESKSSCILFKVAGKITCPVVPTKKSNASGGQSGGASSGTTAAIVIIVILVIIVAAVIIAFIIWKRRRGENVWLMDQISSIVTKARDRSSPKAKEEEHPEQIYAEIPDQPVQPKHSQHTPEETVTQAQAGTKTAILLTGGSVVPEERPTDDDGYAEPPDSPVYKELEDPNEQSTGDDGWAGIPDSHSQQNGSKEVTVGNVTSSGATAPGLVLSDAADNRYVAKQRRKPPSPPQKGNDTKERGLNSNDGIDIKDFSQKENDMNHDYERLRDDNRDVYQPLNRNTMDNKLTY